MDRKRRRPALDLHEDPFAEHGTLPHRADFQVLGSRFIFESNSAALLAEAARAYAGLPAARPRGKTADCRIRLWALEAARSKPAALHLRGRGAAPEALAMVSGPGLIGGATPDSDAVLMAPEINSALVLVSARRRRSPYHVRYEMVEFAVFTLASRCQGLVSLHGACIAQAGRGILLMGSSGAGKSTVTLLALHHGFEMLSEDSVFVRPDRLEASGVPNFLHVREDSLRWLGRSRDAGRIRRAPVIRRRSGVEKYALDLRTSPYGITAGPVEIAAVVFLSAQRAGSAPQARKLPRRELLGRLRHAQGYAAGQPGWAAFCRTVARAGGYEIRRGAHPQATVELLSRLLCETPRAARRAVTRVKV